MSERSYAEFVERARAKHGAKFDDSNLAPQFIRHFESGERIEIRMKFGEVIRGRVGVTTGWAPVFILMLTTRSIGSSWTLSKDDHFLKVIPTRRCVNCRRG